jgi:hypothetical protein
MIKGVRLLPRPDEAHAVALPGDAVWAARSGLCDPKIGACPKLSISADRISTAPQYIPPDMLKHPAGALICTARIVLEGGTMEFDTDWVTLGKHRVRLHATRGFPAERLRIVAEVARLAIESNMSARARLVEVVFRDQDGVYDISIGTTIAEDRTCAASIEAALATIFGLTPEQVVLTVKAVSQDEVDLSFGTYERLLAQKIGATAPIQ